MEEEENPCPAGYQSLISELAYLQCSLTSMVIWHTSLAYIHCLETSCKLQIFACVCVLQFLLAAGIWFQVPADLTISDLLATDFSLT